MHTLRENKTTNQFLEKVIEETLRRDVKCCSEKCSFLEKVIEETLAFNRTIRWDTATENLRLAQSTEELMEVFKLRSQIYTKLGYQNEWSDLIQGLNFDEYDMRSAIIINRRDGNITGTTRLIVDSDFGLPTESKYAIQTIREKYHNIVEFSRLIVKHDSSNLCLDFKYLMRGIYTVMRQNNMEIAISAIKQDHYKLYTKMGGVEIKEALESYGKMGKSVYILSYEPSQASKLFKKMFL